MALRPYQEKAVAAGIAFLNSKSTGSKAKDRGVIIAPTAAGKSHIIAAIAKEVGKVVVLQPSQELLKQNYAKYVADGCEASIYSASLNEKNVGHVTFATIGSIKSKGHLFSGAVYFPRDLVGFLHGGHEYQDGLSGDKPIAGGKHRIHSMNDSPLHVVC